MIYTIHIGPRSMEWPSRIAQAPTRSEAQQICKSALKLAPEGWDKGEVRLGSGEYAGRLLDSYGRRPSGSIRQSYAFQQRDRSKVIVPPDPED